jgi:hypothetical protein
LLVPWLVFGVEAVFWDVSYIVLIIFFLFGFEQLIVALSS